VSENRLAIERVIPASPEDLFELWTDPTEMVKWWAPEGYDCSVDCLELTPAGRWRILMWKPGSDRVALGGVYRVIDPPERLSFTWAWEDSEGAPGHETEVSVSFHAVPGGTRLVLTQQTFDSTQTRDRHRLGWSAAFDRLTRLHAKS
jgi:uncharacterized protein YndB with AHSA1/START domain